MTEHWIIDYGANFWTGWWEIDQFEMGEWEIIYYQSQQKYDTYLFEDGIKWERQTDL